LPRALEARTACRLLTVALGTNRDTGEDAYDTLGLATCATLRPSEKYHRRPACVPRVRAGNLANGSGGKNGL
jgi:hypothetical protein